MSTGKIEIICGNGSGKTALAVGRGIQALARQKTVVMIQFLKGNRKQEDLEVIERLEPEFKVFRFEKSAGYYEELSETEKQEERLNILNGLNYAKKVLTTGECDLLILDEMLGILDLKIIEEDDLKLMLDCRDEADVILTGRVLPKKLCKIADSVNKIEHVQVDNYGG